MSDELEFAPVTEDGVWEDESDFDGYVLSSPALQARIDEAVQQAQALLAARAPAQDVLREAA